MRTQGNHLSKKLAFSPSGSEAVLVKLLSVTITHTFYTEEHALCPDLDISPTPSTSSLMTKLGMAFRPERAGFSVFIERLRQADLLNYLQQNATLGKDGEPEYWQRLTFSMRLKNRYFVDITQLPLDTKTSQVNLYGCNDQSHQGEAAAVLSAGRFIGAESLYPVIGAEVSLSVPPGTRQVVVTDIAGQIVISQPDDDDDDDDADAVAIDAALHGEPGSGVVLLNFSDLPYGKYTITALDDRQQSIDDDIYPWTVLYVAPQPDSMVLLDMLFTQPTAASTGVYPVSSLFATSASDSGSESAIENAPTITATAYRLPFDARRTYWQYFVVSQDPQGQLRDLQIKGPGAQFVQDPQPAILPGGASAAVFISDTALPLRQKSAQHFQLSGQRRDADGHDNAIRIARLPVAARTPVWPSPDQQFASGISEIFVYV